jgi:hypothetical protein
MACPPHAGSKKNRNRVFRINAQINAYLAKQLSVTSINSRQAAGKYDARLGRKVGTNEQKEEKSGQWAPNPTF